MDISKKIKTIDIELAIMYNFNFNQKLIVPNLTYSLGFETDMAVISESNYVTGFEIKVSLSDLKADLKKKHIKELNIYKYGKSGLERYFYKFKYFNYAVPEYLKENALKQIPDFCGLYILKNKNKIGTTFEEIKKPKKLFDYKLSMNEKYNIARLGAMRIYNLKMNQRK